MIFQGIEILTSFLEPFIGFWMYARIKKKPFLWKESMAITVVLTLVVSSINQITLFSMITSIVGVFLISLGVYIVYRDSYPDCVSVIGIYMMIIYIVDFFTLSLGGYLLNRPDLFVLVITRNTWQRAAFILITKVLLAIVCSFLPKLYNRFIPKDKNLKLLIILGIIALYYVVQKTIAQADNITFMTWIYMFTVAFFSLYVVLQHQTIEAERRERLLEKKINYMVEENQKAYVENEEINRIFYHDLKNQFVLLHEYLNNNQYQEAKDYINGLQFPKAPEKGKKLTGIEALDILLHYKRIVAEIERIPMYIMAEPIQLPLSDYEYVALFGNLLDNAIEASLKVPVEERSIKINIQRINDMTFVTISNNFGMIEENGHGLISNKQELGEHGIGLHSVRTIVEKYKGLMDIKHENHVFTVELSFFCKC